MKIAASIFKTVARPRLRLMKISLAMVLLINAASGCASVIRNSESFYEEVPRPPINWREYLTD
jgi:hypothetical protein